MTSSAFPCLRASTRLILGSSVWLNLALTPSLAQPIAPASDGTGTQVQQQGDQFNISGGTQSGANQFHSFEQFGLESQQTVNFQTDPGTANVLGRVTGGDASVINGTVQVTGSEANLYLMNPAGMVLGEKARLDVPGSFHGTTADSIGFEGGEFSARSQNRYENLAGAPNRFNFEAGSQGAIVNQGDLAVNQGKNLSLTGSTVINTGTLTAPGGQAAVVAVPTDQGSQSVRITQNGMVMGLEVGADRLSQQNLSATDLSQNPTHLPKVLTGGTVDHATDLRVIDRRVYLTGSGLAIDPLTGAAVVAGSVNVSSPDPWVQGGQVLVQGDRVQVLDARISAQGNQSQVQIQGRQSAIVQSSQLNLSNLVGIGELLKLQGPSVSLVNSTIAANGNQGGGLVQIQASQGLAQLHNSIITVTSGPGAGGRVEVLGDRVEILASTIDASGVAGGEIYIGGDYQGGNSLQTAQETLVDADSLLLAEGLGWNPAGTPLPTPDLPNALGGRVIVWADDKTRFYGVLKAKGAAEFSDSGFAEISGKQFLDLGQDWDQRIRVGELLLDPTDVVITAGTGTYGTTTISNYLENTGNLTITTAIGGADAGNITVNGAISWASGNSLTLRADRSIILSAGSSITSTSGDITLEANLAGTATASSDGISLTGASINTTSGVITLTGQGGSGGANGKVGIILSNSQINSVSGDITLTGTGGSNAATDSNSGISLTQGSFIISTGTGADAAKITLVGVGGAGTNFNHGVVLRNVNGVATPDVGIRSAEGAISLRGTGSGSGTLSMGIQLGESARIESTGSGTTAASISLEADFSLAGPGTGIFVVPTGSPFIGSTTGTGAGAISLISDRMNLANLTLQGTGHLTIAPLDGTKVSGSFNANLSIVPSSFTRVTLGSVLADTVVSGNAILGADTTFLGNTIDFSGSLNTSRDVTFNAARNISFASGASITATGAGSITLEANQGPSPATGTFNGIDLTLGSTLSTNSGDITLTGKGGTVGGGDSNGIDLRRGSTIQTTSGNITLNGQGQASGFNNLGIRVEGVGTAIIANAGSITLNGIGGDNSSAQHGVVILDGSQITSTGTATITLNGTGGNTSGQGFQQGVRVFGGSTIRTVDGDITFNGIGGTDATGANLPGIYLDTAVESTGSGNIRLHGTGRLSTSQGYGIWVDTAGSITATGTGSVSLTGIGGTGTTDLSGILLAGTVQSAIGAILLNGTGGLGTGANNPGVEINGGRIESTGTGATAAPITIIATGGGGSTPPPALSILNGAAVTAVDGAIDLTGTSNGTNPINRGIVITGSTVATTGTGTLRLQVPTATLSDAIALLSNASLGSATGSGTITLIAPTLALDSANIRGMGLLTLTPLDPASSIGLGDNVTGDFNLTALELNNIAPTFSSIDIGVVGGTGSVRVGLGINAPVAALVNLLGGSDLGAGDNDGNQWVLTGSNSGTINGIRFQGFTSLLGGSLGDSLQGTIGNDSFQITGADQITVGTMTFTSVETLAGDAGDDEFVLAGGTLTGAIAGGTGSNTLTAGNLSTNFVITGTDSGTVTGVTGGFTGIQNLNGGTANDRFTLAGGTLSGFVDGGAGLNTLIADNRPSTVILTADNQGSITGISGTFSNMGNLTGGSGADTFSLTAGTLSGAIDGGAGIDSLITPNRATTFGITGTNSGTLTGVANGFQNLENLTGNAQGDIFQFTAAGSIQGTIDGAGGSDLLIADDGGAFIDISGTDGGTYSGKVAAWRNIENMQGGAGNDTFLLSANTLTGTLDGGGGSDTIVGDTVANEFVVLMANGGTVTGVWGGFSSIENLVGNTQADSFLIASTGSLAGLIDGAGGVDTLQSGDSGVTFTITGVDSGTLQNFISGFVRVENLTGGTGNDLFFLEEGSLSGLIDGGPGIDFLFGGDSPNIRLETPLLLAQLINPLESEVPIGLYDVMPPNGDPKISEVSEVSQRQVLVYNPADFGLDEGEVAINEAAVDTGVLGETVLDPDAAAGAVTGAGSDRTTGTANSDNSSQILRTDSANQANHADSTGSSSSNRTASPTANASPAAGPGAGSGTGAERAIALVNPGSDADAAANAAPPDAAAGMVLPDPNAPDAGSNSDSDLPDPNGADSTGNAAPEDAPDPTTIASAPALEGEAATNENGMGTGLAIAAVVAALATAGGAAAIATGAGTTALQTATKVAQNLAQGLQNLASGSGPGGSAGTGGLEGVGGENRLGFPLAAAAAAVGASQAQQYLTQIRVALEPRVESQLNVSLQKEEGASLTGRAIEMADQEIWEDAGLETATEGLPGLGELLGVESGGLEIEAEESELEAEEVDTEGLAVEAEAVGPIAAMETDLDEAEAEQLGRVEAVKGIIAEAAAKAGIPEEAVDAIYEVAIEKIGEILSEIDLAGGILGEAWSKVFEIVEYRQLLDHIRADGAVMIPLVTHEILAEQSPSIDLKFQETPVGSFAVDLSLGIVVNGATLAMEGGKLTHLHLGSMMLSGGVAFAGLPLFEAPEAGFEINRIIRLGDGIHIKLR